VPPSSVQQTLGSRSLQCVGQVVVTDVVPGTLDEVVRRQCCICQKRVVQCWSDITLMLSSFPNAILSLQLRGTGTPKISCPDVCIVYEHNILPVSGFWLHPWIL